MASNIPFHDQVADGASALNRPLLYHVLPQRAADVLADHLSLLPEYKKTSWRTFRA